MGGGYSWSSSTESSFTTGYLSSIGTNTFTNTVTDTRGFTSTRTINIQVEPYAPPSILSAKAYRSLPSGAQSETGSHISFQLSTTFSSINEKNIRTMRVAFKRLGDDIWSSNYIIPNDGTWVIPANIVETESLPYQIRLIVSDSLNTITQYFDVEGTKYTLYFPQGG